VPAGWAAAAALPPADLTMNPRGAQGTPWAKANKKQLAGVFTYLDFCLEQIVKDNELGALRQALEARAPAHPASPGVAAASVLGRLLSGCWAAPERRA
jgi:hypothetical protein